MCTNTVVVIDAALSACSSPGIRSLSVIIASAMVCGLPAMIVCNSVAYRLRLSVIVVSAAACSVLSSGTGLTLLVVKVFPSSSCTTAGWGKLVTTCMCLDQVDSSILLFKPLFFPLSVLNPPSFCSFACLCLISCILCSIPSVASLRCSSVIESELHFDCACAIKTASDLHFDCACLPSTCISTAPVQSNRPPNCISTAPVQSNRPPPCHSTAPVHSDQPASDLHFGSRFGFTFATG